MEKQKTVLWSIDTTDDGAHLTLFEEGVKPIHICCLETPEQKKAVARFKELADLCPPVSPDEVPGPKSQPGTCPDCGAEYDLNEDRCPKCHRWTGR